MWLVFLNLDIRCGSKLAHIFAEETWDSVYAITGLPQMELEKNVKEKYLVK